MLKIYICGPMTGLPDLNFPAFDEARDKLVAEGHWVYSPADLERNRTPRSYQDNLKDDLKYLVKCDSIYLLKGWEKSNGARLEKFVAQKLGFTFRYQEGAVMLNLELEVEKTNAEIHQDFVMRRKWW